MKDLQLLKSCFLVVFLLWIPSVQSEPETIQTSSGPIQGSPITFNGKTISEYLGIPYAQPPLKDLRFKKPKPVQAWSDTLKANEMPPACMQYSVYPFPWYDFQKNKSEDCLYLNMWVPEAKEGDSQKAVMFWIYGGGFVYGSIRKPVYNGRALAAVGDVIVVTVNYRLGAFGFFTTNTDAAPVNNAMYDMLEALKWVNKNAAAFGGDPKRITIFGESAGSIAVGLFCVSPLTKGLFKRVIMESGSHANILLDVNTTSLVISQKLAEAFGCAVAPTDIVTFPDKVADCMREQDAEEIAKTLNSFDPNTGATYVPTYDDEFLPPNGRLALIAGEFHDVSVLIGNNRDEGSPFLTASNPELFGFFGKSLPNLNISIAEKLLEGTFKNVFKDLPNTDLIKQTISGTLKEGDSRKNLKLIYDLMGDSSILCPSRYFAESLSRYGKDVHYYFFAHRPSKTPWAEWMGVAHYEEVKFVFGVPLRRKGFTKEEVKLSKLMMKMWSNFAKYGDPLHEESKNSNPHHGGLLQSGQVQNALKLEKWPKYTRETPFYLNLNTNTIKTKQYKLGPHKINCELFRGIHGFP